MLDRPSAAPHEKNAVPRSLSTVVLTEPEYQSPHKPGIVSSDRPIGPAYAFGEASMKTEMPPI
jgi:hypothetical protein